MDEQIDSLDQKSVSLNSANGPRSLFRILNIFETLSDTANGMTLTELSQTLASPKSSLLGLLRPLVVSRHLTVQGNHYKLGSAMMQLSLNILAKHSYSSLTRVFLEELATRSNESVYLTEINRSNHVVTYIDSIECNQAVRYAVSIGATRPLYVSAAGRALLSFQEPKWIESFLSMGPFRSPVNSRLISINQLRKDVKQVQSEKCAVSLSQTVEGAAGVASPIIHANGKATHALLIAGPIDRMQKTLPEMRALVIEVAQRASGVFHKT